RPRRPPLFPYTTLFRSEGHLATRETGGERADVVDRDHPYRRYAFRRSGPDRGAGAAVIAVGPRGSSCWTTPQERTHRVSLQRLRSEEHTSELQSRRDLV